MATNSKVLRVGTLFSGIGAFEQALKQMSIPHEIVFACDNGERYLKETDEYLQAVTEKMTQQDKEMFIRGLYERTGKPNNVRKSYEANYGAMGDRWHDDIRFMDGKQYAGKVDILVGGSPCQSFSTYGKKLGLEDARGTLFYDYARIIKESQPRVFIYENVKGLLTHDHGNTWKVMKGVWESLGYQLNMEVLNAADFNHPQLRKRLFIVGIRQDVADKNEPYAFPIPMQRTIKSYDLLEKGEVDPKYYLGEKGFRWVTNPIKNQRKSRVNQEVHGCQTANQQDNWIGDLIVEPAKPWHYEDPRIYVGKYAIDGLNEVDAVARKMTPDECLRMMGFVDFKHAEGIEDRVLYRQSGNSIVVPVLREIIKTLAKYL